MKILPNFKQVFSREASQLAYGILLILIIPTLVVVNTVFIIRKYNESIDVSLQRHALNVGRLVYAEFKPILNDQALWQQKIDDLFFRSGTLTELEVLVPLEDDFKIIASSNQEQIGKTYVSDQQSFAADLYSLAWLQPDNDGSVTNSNLIPIENRQSLNLADLPSRIWLVHMPMKNLDGKKVALLSLKINSEIVDEITLDSEYLSIVFVAITILVIILFLFIATRLWDYALLYRRIREVDQMKDEFISMASHELRTPITAIRGYLSMIIEGSMGTINLKVKDALVKVDISSERLHNLVEDLLNVSKIEQGRIEIKEKPLEISKSIEEVVDELSVRAKDANLKLEYSKPSRVLPNIKADPDRIKQILINIISNAIKYTKKGSVKISLASVKNNIEIKVKDTGIGMTADQRQHLFEKFYRVKNESTKKVKGTGLGLWITKKLVELQQGKIVVDSIENVGTQVTIIFPKIKSK